MEGIGIVWSTVLAWITDRWDLGPEEMDRSPTIYTSDELGIVYSPMGSGKQRIEVIIQGLGDIMDVDWIIATTQRPPCALLFPRFDFVLGGMTPSMMCGRVRQTAEQFVRGGSWQLRHVGLEHLELQAL